MLGLFGGGKKSISIITPGSTFAPILLFEISESEETEHCIEAFIFFLFPDVSGALALVGQGAFRGAGRTSSLQLLLPRVALMMTQDGCQDLIVRLSLALQYNLP